MTLRDMHKRRLFPLIVLLLMWPVLAYPRQHIGLGLHLGAHHNVGRLSDYNGGFDLDPQNNYLIGFAFKANYRFLFLRTGVDTSFILNKGRVLENSDPNDPVQRYRITYTEIPCFIGLNFPVQDIGEFYMGGGIAYFIGNGTVTTSTSTDIDATALGFGFITGIQIYITSTVRLYMEWQYLDARSEPVANTVTAPQTWDNYYIDFSGHRLLAGIMYYVW